MIEPHMTLAILSLQKTCQRPAGPKDEDAFYQQYREPFYQRLYQGWVRLYTTFRGRRQARKDVTVGPSLAPNLKACR
jgi:hypothetical protein